MHGEILLGELLLVATLVGSDFERDVAPLLEQRCLACHDDAHAKGGLSLASAASAARGGKSGDPALVARAPDRSALLAAVTSHDGKRPRMPKGRAPLAERDVAALRDWIAAGAEWPAERTLLDRSAELEFEQRRDWWSLKPLARVVPPPIDDAPDEIDRFLLAKLHAAGVEPAPPADARTLIRRVTWDLSGLPPTPEEVAAFVAECAAGDAAADRAYERLVDRLLASPRFGERFARGWLDLVHFGETHGYDKDKPRPNAWPYRDWVIGAFNDDLPFADFLERQIAADVVAPDEPSSIAALGFLAAGPWDYVGHVELREGTVDKAITRNLDRDDVVSNVLSTFASTTVHCARCHDHKFDAIGQRDYYALQAVFAGVERTDRPFDHDPAVARQRAFWEQQRADVLARLDEAGAKSPTRERLGWHGAITKSADTVEWLQVDLGASVAFDELLLVPAHESYGGWPGPGFGFPLRFRVEVADDASFAAPRVLLERTAADFVNPGDAPLAIAGDGVAARFVRVTATKLWRRTDDFAFALGELVCMKYGRDLARGKPATASDSIEAPPRWALANVTDGSTWLGDVEGTVRDAVDGTDRWRDAWSALASIEAELAALPPPSRVYAVASRFAADGAFTPPDGPRPIHVLARGEVARPLELVEPAALRSVAELPSRFELPPGADESQRRAALARWLADRRNPLTWRSIANRVWQWHFGRGLVDTPNDFGHMGSAPSHPELLDWLASWLLDHGGSLKALHRKLVLTAAYRASSGAGGDERLFGRKMRARLDAEPLRDGLLAIAGRLDLAMGGPSQRQFRFQDDHSPVYDYAGFDPGADGGAAERRRSIYRFTVRSVPDPWLEALDCPDASMLTPKRNVTITALQALALLNDPFVIRQCEALAARVAAERPGDLAAELARAFELALARAPTSGELAALVAHAQAHGLAAACRVIVNLDEFVFVD